MRHTGTPALELSDIQPKPSISACLIVKNEAHCLARCLDSLQGLVDEIILVDTGSTDTTLEIAQRYTDKIYHYAWNDHFAQARNFGLQYATQDWILVIDADEYFPDLSTQRQLQAKLASLDPLTEACLIHLNFATAGKRLLKRVIWARAAQLHFRGHVHEYLVDCDGNLPPTCEWPEIVLQHPSSRQRQEAKALYYLKLMEHEQQQGAFKPRRLMELNWHRYQAYRVLGQHAEAQNALSRACTQLESLGPQPVIFDYALLLHRLQALLQHKPPKLLQAENLAQKTMALLPRQAEGWWLMAWILAWKGKYREAVGHLNQAILLAPMQGQNLLMGAKDLRFQMEFLEVRALAGLKQWVKAIEKLEALYLDTRAFELLVYRIYLGLCETGRMGLENWLQHLPSRPDLSLKEQLLIYRFWMPLEEKYLKSV